VDLTNTTHQRALLYLRAVKHNDCPVALSCLQDLVDRHRYEGDSANLNQVLPAIQRSLSKSPDKHQSTPPKLSRGRIGYQDD